MADVVFLAKYCEKERGDLKKKRKRIKTFLSMPSSLNPWFQLPSVPLYTKDSQQSCSMKVHWN